MGNSHSHEGKKLIDIHCHILPGIDDGADDWEQSFEMARIAARDGITALVCTPHCSPAFPSNNRKAILAAVDEFRTRLDGEGIQLDIHAGCEMVIDFDLPEKIESGELLTMNDNGRFALVEIPSEIIPPNLNNLFWKMQTQGITPILAHPERNWLIMKNPSMLLQWVEAGALVQITRDTLEGHLGRKNQDFCFDLIRSRMVHFVATDSHSPNRRRPVLSEAHDITASIIGVEEAHRIFYENPLSILRGEIPYTEEPIPPRRGKEKTESLARRLFPFW